MTTLIFERRPARTSPEWIVKGSVGETVGSIQWHESMAVYGFAAAPGRSFLQLEDEAMREIGEFLDELNAC